MEELILVFFAILLLFFMLVGFIQTCVWIGRLFSPPTASKRSGQTDTSPNTSMPSPVSAVHLLDALFLEGKISAATYQETRNAVETKFARLFELPKRIELTKQPSLELPPTPTLAEQTIPNSQVPIASPVELKPNTLSVDPTGLTPPIPPITKTVETAPVPTVPHEPKIPIAEIVHTEPPSETTLATSAGDAPWNQPDPPLAAPRLGWRALLQRFMEARNIRWGELASGILIVGSAVGLVISLRKELENSIPYFPALLFMLISLAIHGAGRYTLKRWKLQQTSRGLLLIGLLIVPLNFLAGVLLSSSGVSQRPLSDPIVWLAIAIGLGVFGWISWSTGKLLLRRGGWLLSLPVMLSGLAIIVTHRFPIPLEPRDQWWLAVATCLGSSAVMIVLSLIVEGRRQLTLKTLNRVAMVGGVTWFSLLAALSMLLVSSMDRVWSWAGIVMPLSLVMIASLDVATSVYRRSKGRGLAGYRIGAAAMVGLFAFAGFAFALWALPFPTELVRLAVVAGVGLVAWGWLRRIYIGVPLGAALFAIAGAMAWLLWRGVEVDAGRMGWDGSRQLFFGARSALVWIVAGIGLAAATPAVKRRFKGPLEKNYEPEGEPSATPAATSINLLNLICAFAFAGLGSVLGVVAARMNPEDFFDATVGTSLLSFFALALMAVALWPKFSVAKFPALGLVGLLFVTLAGFESLFGNLFLIRWLGEFDMGWEHRAVCWSLVVALTSGMAAIIARGILPKTSHAADWMMWRVDLFSVVAVVIGLLGLVGTWGLLAVPYSHVQLGLGAGLLVAVAAGAWGGREQLGGALEVATAFGLCGVVGSWFQAHGDLPNRLETPWHWLAQAHAVAVWGVVWQLVAGLTRGGRWDWLTNWRVDGRNVSFFGSVVVLLLLAIWTVFGLANPVFREVAVDWSRAGASDWDVTGLMLPLSTALLVGLVAAFISMWWERVPHQQPMRVADSGEGNEDVVAGAEAEVAAEVEVQSENWVLPSNWGASCVLASLVLGLASLVAIQGGHWDFDKGTATALRWLMALGGFGVAVLVWLVPRDERDGGGQVLQLGWIAAGLRSNIVALVLTLFAGASLVLGFFHISTLLLVGPQMIGGPAGESLLGKVPKVASFGVPVGIILATFLFLANSERKNLLAVWGSYALRAMVVAQLVLLFLSPHPALATEWFVRTVQYVSLGMTVYGLVWFATRERVGTVFERTSWSGSLQVHTFVNAGLLLGLIGLIVARSFLMPLAGGGWVNEAAGPVGILATVAFASLWWLVLWQGRGTSASWPLTLLGLAAVAMVAATLDRSQCFGAIVPYQWLTWGFVGLAMANVGGWWQVGRMSAEGAGSLKFGRDVAPLLMVLVGGILYAVRGYGAFPSWFWAFFAALVVLMLLVLVVACVLQRADVPFYVAGLTTVMAGMLWDHDPWGTFEWRIVSLIQLVVVGWVFVALVLAGFSVAMQRLYRRSVRRAFLIYSSYVPTAAVIWFGLLLLGSWFLSQVAQWLMPETLELFRLQTVLLMGLVSAAIVVGLWNERGQGRVVGPWLLTMVLATWFLSWLGWRGFLPEFRVEATTLLVISGLVCGWSYWLMRRRMARQVFRALKVRRFAAWHERARRWFGVSGLVWCALTIVVALVFVFLPRVGLYEERYLAAFSVPLVGFAFVFLANGVRHRLMQLVALGVLAVGAIFLSWIPGAIDGYLLRDEQRLQRGLMVLGGAVVLYGVLGPRWLRAHDSWLKSIQRSAMACMVVAIAFLMMLVAVEWLARASELPIGLSTMEAVIVLVISTGIAAALVWIAVLPERDPLSLSLEGRKGYVYAAQLVLALVVFHVIATMPWLLRLGLRDYWPYIAMAVAFGGVSLGHLLQQRRLDVLAEPLRNTMALLPIAVGMAIFGVESRADASIACLLAGLVYGWQAMLRPSIWSALLALLFGNLSLWLFLGKYPDWSFVNHPQLWLIPPALSVLVATWWHRERFTSAQVRWAQSLSIAVIYLASTSEVFIYGLGEQLWPPMILALLAVGGMVLGMGSKSREFIGLSMVFLLLAVIAMVANAQRRLDHVWPWWAFGITLGIAILAGFALLEKRRNQQRRLSQSMDSGEQE